jgi:hypothetical protein
MSTDTVNDVTSLFEFARDWYHRHPGEQIPIYDWDRQVSQVSESSDNWVIYEGGYSIQPRSHNIIPCLAAISMDMEPDALLPIMKHHEVTCYHISHTHCEQIYDDPFDYDTAQKTISLAINEALIQVVMLDDELSDAFFKEYMAYGVNDDLEIAWLLYDHAKFWPATVVEHHKSLLSQSNVKNFVKAPDVTHGHTFLNSNLNFNTLSNKQVIKMLQRSGNLTLGVTAENGFEPNMSNSFFWHLLSAKSKGPDNPNVERTLEAINTVQDETMIAHIRSRILESVCEDSRNMEGGVRLLAEFLDDQRYGSIANDLVFNLKLMGRNTANDPPSSPPVSFGNNWAEKIVYTPELVLEQLCDDLKALTPQGLRKPHFEAIDALVSQLTITGDAIKGLCKELLFLALEGLDAYRETPFFVSKQLNPLDVVSSSLERLIRLVASDKDIDYAEFARYSSGSKALLAGNGFDLKKLPGITTRHRGQLLSDQLGL